MATAKRTDLDQLRQFKEAARELECDDDPEHFAATVRKIATAPPAPHGRTGRAKAAASGEMVVQTDATALISALEQATELLERFPEFGKGCIGLGNIALELCSINADVVSASGASKLVVRLEPSDLLLSYLATLRARDSNLPGVQ